MRQRHRKLTEAELTEAIRKTLVSLAHPPATGYCEVPVLQVEGWYGLVLDGWPKDVKANSLLGVNNRGTPETYGHNEAERLVKSLKGLVLWCEQNDRGMPSAEDIGDV